MNISGASPREILRGQTTAQRLVAESDKWLLARRINPGGDSRVKLMKLGFKVIAVRDDLFYEVEAPEGWTKSTNGYWTRVLDKSGVERFLQFYKGAFYDRSAFISLK